MGVEGNNSSSNFILMASLEQLRLEMGIKGPIFLLKNEIFFSYVTSCWDTKLFEFIFEVDIEIEDRVPEIGWEGENDKMLMEEFVKAGFHGVS